MKKVKFYACHDFKKHTVCLRSIHVLPSFSVSLYESYKFESIRISWLGLDIGLYLE